MAKRRMFSIDLIESDAFTDLSQSSRLLYVYLLSCADDDGFFSGTIKKALFLSGASQEDFDNLINSGFVLAFERCYVIKHWKAQNRVKSDRYKKTVFQPEFSRLVLSETDEYILIDELTEPRCIQNDSNVDTEWKQDGYTDKVSTDKYRVDKDSINEDSVGEGRGAGGTLPIGQEEIDRYCRTNGINLSDFPDASVKAACERTDWKTALDTLKAFYRAGR